jgi:hypothetical protein
MSVRQFKLGASGLLVLFATLSSLAQKAGNERAFSQPASAIQAALKKLQASTSGRLPVLDGFVIPGSRMLDQYQRPFYQCTVQVVPARLGSLVRVSARITAWHSDPAHPGYEVLPSNGRLESDLLDRLQEALGTKAESHTANASTPAPAGTAMPEISAPVPQLPQAKVTPSKPADSVKDTELQQEAKNLEDILQNQSRPTNLIAVKQDQTPILQNPSADAKVLFLASAEDEFEVLDLNPEWVHVRISGLSRGWLRRSTVQLLDGSDVQPAKESVGNPQTLAQPAPPQAARAFSISSEEVGSFPGNWAPLIGKSVKIISVQQAPGSGRITSPQDKLRFAESVFREQTLPAPAAGLVLIFDSEDGGMVATAGPALAQWKSGDLSEAAFWKQCLLDPPEILGGLN